MTSHPDAEARMKMLAKLHQFLGEPVVVDHVEGRDWATAGAPGRDSTMVWSSGTRQAVRPSQTFFKVSQR